jgi:hypothetical protein
VTDRANSRRISRLARSICPGPQMAAAHPDRLRPSGSNSRNSVYYPQLARHIGDQSNERLSSNDAEDAETALQGEMRS